MSKINHINENQQSSVKGPMAFNTHPKFLAEGIRLGQCRRLKIARFGLMLSALLCLMPAPGMAKFEQLANLETVSVATEPDFLVLTGRSLQQTWILLNFKQEQRLDVASPEPLGPRISLAYRSRMDYVQVDCRRNLYTELATQMFPEAEGKGSPVYESTFHRSGLPRFATPESHEGKVVAFLCRGVRPPAN